MISLRKQLFSKKTPGTFKKGLYAGSFDPPSTGHLDIIERASKICDELYVGVAVNINKR